MVILIYTDARHGSPYEKGEIYWESGVGIGAILVIRCKVCAYCAMGKMGKYPHWLKGSMICTD